MKRGVLLGIVVVGLVACGGSVDDVASDTGAPVPTVDAGPAMDGAADTDAEPPLPAGPLCSLGYDGRGVARLYDMCDVGELDARVECKVNGVDITWRCSSRTPNPCPTASLCRLQNRGVGVTTHACVADENCADFLPPMDAGAAGCVRTNQDPADPLYNDPSARVCGPI